MDDDFPDEDFENFDTAGSSSGVAGTIVTARGTSQGLVIRLDSRVSESSLLEALEAFVSSRQAFLRGNEVALEWVGGDASPKARASVLDFLRERYSIEVADFLEADDVRPAPFGEQGPGASKQKGARQKPVAGEENAVSLFGGIEAFSMRDELPPVEAAGRFQGTAAVSESMVSESMVWDDPNARLVYTTLRSGQKIETEHSLIICGDVNSGAEVVAGGDVFVLGTLRGVAHAGAYDETGGGSFIFALNLAPTQLRIGSVISRGPADGGNMPEIARVDGDIIVVEPYQSRSRLIKKAVGRRNELESVAES